MARHCRNMYELYTYIWMYFTIFGLGLGINYKNMHSMNNINLQKECLFTPIFFLVYQKVLSHVERSDLNI
jgi:hypothetical protein